MNTILTGLMLLAAICMGCISPAMGSDREVVLSAAIQLKVADAFLAEKEYYRAITEYKRFLILFPDDRDADSARFGIGMAHFKVGEYEAAARAFSLANATQGSRRQAEAGYFEGISYWKLGRWEQAGTAFEKVATGEATSGYARSARLAKALMAFDARSPEVSRHELELFLSGYPEDTRTPKVHEALTLLDQEQALPEKSPRLAGALSAVLPGAGHVYAGHYRDGITSLLVNGLFIAGTAVAIHQENYAVAAIVGGVGLPFYFGNIYGAANAATKWNLSLRRELRERLAITLDVRF